MHHRSRFGACLAVLLACCAAAPLVAQSPQWTARFNDVAAAADWVTAVLPDEQGGAYCAGYNDTGWTAWRIGPDGQTQWHWHGLGLPRGDGQPLIAGVDDTGNLCLWARAAYGLATARIAPDGQSADVHRYDTPAYVRDAVVTPTGAIVATGGIGSADDHGDVFTIQFAPDGETDWLALYDGADTSGESGAVLALGQTGDVYIAGRASLYTGQRTYRYVGLVLRYAAAGELVWSQIVDPDSSNPDRTPYPTDLAVDSSGNAYVGGWKRTSSTAPYEGVIFKIAADGTLLWLDESFGPLYLQSTRVLLDESRSAVYLAGDLKRTDEDIDFRLIRYGPDGAINWVAHYDGPAHGRDYVSAAGLDSTGHIHLIGTSYAAEDNPDLTVVQFDETGMQVSVGRSDNEASKYDRVRTGAISSQGHAIIVGGEHADSFDSRVVGFNSAGQVEWNVVLSTSVPSRDAVSDAAVDATGAIYVLGSSDRRQTDDGPALIQRYSPTGVLEWERRLPIADRDPGNLAIDSSGNVVVVCRHYGDENGNMGVLKYTPDGTLIWSGHYAGPQQVTWLQRRMALDAQGNLFVCGDIEHSNWNGNSDYDGLLVSVDANGALRWTHALAGNRVELFRALAADASGAVTVAGVSRQHLYNSPNEIVTIRYGASGEEQWEHRYIRSDSTEGDQPVAAAIAEDGVAYVAARMGEEHDPHSVLLLCYSPAGELNWVRDFQAEGAVSTSPVDLRSDSNGDLVVLCSAQAADGTLDVLLLCYSPAGELRWAHRQAGPAYYSEVSRFLEISATGDLLVSADTFSGPSYQFYNSMLLRVDGSGAPRWTSRQPDPAELSGWMVALRPYPDGGFIVAGTTEQPETRSDMLITRYGPPPPACPAVDPCAGDLDGDCRVGFADLQMVLSRFGAAEAVGFAPLNGDTDFDGDVDLQDLTSVLAAWGSDCR